MRCILVIRPSAATAGRSSMGVCDCILMGRNVLQRICLPLGPTAGWDGRAAWQGPFSWWPAADYCVAWPTCCCRSAAVPRGRPAACGRAQRHCGSGASLVQRAVGNGEPQGPSGQTPARPARTEPRPTAGALCHVAFLATHMTRGSKARTLLDSYIWDLNEFQAICAQQKQHQPQRISPSHDVCIYTHMCVHVPATC